MRRHQLQDASDRAELFATREQMEIIEDDRGLAGEMLEVAQDRPVELLLAGRSGRSQQGEHIIHLQWVNVVDRGRDGPKEADRVVVGLIERHPRDIERRPRRPFREEGRLAPAGRCRNDRELAFAPASTRATRRGRDTPLTGGTDIFD